MVDKFDEIRDYVYGLIRENYPEIDLASNKNLEKSIIEDLSEFSKSMKNDELTDDDKNFLDDYVYDNNELYKARCDRVKEFLERELLQYNSVCLNLIDEKEINAMVEDVIEYADNERTSADKVIYDGYFSAQIDKFKDRQIQFFLREMDIINPEEYDSNGLTSIYEVNLYPGVGVELIPIKMFGETEEYQNFEELLKTAVAYAEKAYPSCLIDISDVELDRER